MTQVGQSHYFRMHIANFREKLVTYSTASERILTETAAGYCLGKHTVDLCIETSLGTRLNLKYVSSRFFCTFTALFCKSFIISGVGEGNRTLVTTTVVSSGWE